MTFLIAKEEGLDAKAAQYIDMEATSCDGRWNLVTLR